MSFTHQRSFDIRCEWGPEGVGALFESASERLFDALASCSSGRELAERGFPEDVRVAAELDADTLAPELAGARFVGAGTEGA